MFDSSIDYGHTKTTDEMIGLFYGEGVTSDQLIAIFEGIKNSEHYLFEMNCHPAFLDKIIMENSSYNTARIQEVALLTSNETKKELQKNNILLTSYAYLN